MLYRMELDRYCREDQRSVTYLCQLQHGEKQTESWKDRCQRFVHSLLSFSEEDISFCRHDYCHNYNTMVILSKDSYYTLTFAKYQLLQKFAMKGERRKNHLKKKVHGEDLSRGSLAWISFSRSDDSWYLRGLRKNVKTLSVNIHMYFTTF